MTLSGTDSETKDLLALSTEDGRILFYDTTEFVGTQLTEPSNAPEIPVSKAMCQLGGPTEGIPGRVKDFEILKPSDLEDFIIVTGSSDGAVRLWAVQESELVDKSTISKDMNSEVSILASNADGKANGNAADLPATRQIGSLLGTYEAGNRITCLKAFVMSEPEGLQTNGSVNGNSSGSESGGDQSRPSG